MNLLNNINLDGTEYEFGGYATRFFTYNEATGKLEFSGATKYRFDHSIETAEAIWTGSKTKTDDGLNGCGLLPTGSLHLQNLTGNPYVGFYGKDQTTYGAYVSYRVDDKYLAFGGADRYTFSAPVYVNGTAVSLNGHNHSWTSVTPTKGDATTLSTTYCAYNENLGLAIIRMTAKIKPTSDVASGTAITVATLSGDIVPDYVSPLATATGSSDPRRWNALITSNGQITVRPSSALTSGTEHNVYICGIYPVTV